MAAAACSTVYPMAPGRRIPQAGIHRGAQGYRPDMAPVRASLANAWASADCRPSPFRLAIRAVPQCETARLTMQNGPFRDVTRQSRQAGIASAE